MLKHWVDIFNGPHVHFFQNADLFFNHSIFTARNYKPIPELIKLYGIDAKIIGVHGGKENIKKLNASSRRIVELADYIKDKNADVAVHKHSVEAARVAWGLGIKSISFIDNELMVPQNMLVCPLSNVLIAPICINQYVLRNFTPSHVSILQFDGVCEVANVYKYKPSENVLKKLNLKTDKPIIVLRGEPLLASYNKKSSIVKNIIEKIKSDVPDAQVVHVSRDGEQIENVQETFDARSLCYYADIVISGGGTMTREAALLGTRAITYFYNPLSVDKYLMKFGLLESYRDNEILNVNWSKEISRTSQNKKKVPEFEHPFSLIDKAEKLISL